MNKSVQLQRLFSMLAMSAYQTHRTKLLLLIQLLLQLQFQHQQIVCAISAHEINKKSNKSILTTRDLDSWWFRIVPTFTEEQFRSNFRMNRITFDLLHSQLAQYYSPYDQYVSRRLDSKLSLMIFLYRLGDPISYVKSKVPFGIPITTQHDHCRIWLKIIVQHLNNIHFPKGHDEWKKIAAEWKKMRVNRNIHLQENKQNELAMPFPNACGAIDGTYIYIRRPKASIQQAYFSRKKRHAINVQAIVDHNGKFISVFTGTPGSRNDPSVLRESDVYLNSFKTIPKGYFILGDAGYPALPWLMASYKPPSTGESMTRIQRKFNYVLSSNRILIERAFGALKGRWRKLKFLDIGNLDEINLYIIAAFKLHNFLLENDDEPDEAWINEALVDEYFHADNRVDLDIAGSNNESELTRELGKSTRDLLARQIMAILDPSYIINEAERHAQEEMIQI